MQRVLKFLVGWIFRFLYPTKVFGTKNLGKKKLVLAMNHYSVMDPVLLIACLKPQIYFWGKKELFKGRFLSWFFRKIGVISLDRKGQDIIAFKKALTLLQNEKKFALFPEGRRNTDDPDRMLKLKRGIALLSIKAQAPIRLAYMLRKPKVFRRNYIIIGDEFSLDEFYGQKTSNDVLDKAMEIVESKYAALKEKLTELLILKGKTIKV